MAGRLSGKIAFCCTIVAALGCASLSLAQEEGTKPANSKIEAMKKRNDTLRAKRQAMMADAATSGSAMSGPMHGKPAMVKPAAGAAATSSTMMSSEKPDAM